jgi:hypothetical protein
MVECQLPKLKVASSSLVTRSTENIGNGVIYVRHLKLARENG